ncbi:phage tail family protein [Paenibacillus tianjinensis]|uniref:Phage tail family protein n=1 Tax=Paenibacillus tianjinensis TaxID=2810347 RepID=A0ABX7L884_9BACL|nr:phage tail domain-containing protein [Paenibacillus tianjinensis]QSF43556.1 phage tail family protein [Paenibacillus tianjinensis]
MTNWKNICNLTGYYTSPTLTLPLICDGALSSITWSQTLGQGDKVVVQSKVSFDGYNWTEWRECVNGGSIPDISEDTYIANTKIVIRIIIDATDHVSPPLISNDITLYFEPVIVFNNKGDVKCKPEIWITKIDSGDFSLINTSRINDEFKFVNLVDQEVIYVNNEREDIQTSHAVTYRYKDFNDNYLNFPPGKNILRATGKAKIKFRYQFGLLQ